ncbi:hypothetical protein FAI40_01185 [Acetobacteraceae bacterium]|nr:hypothetical protein FAI40_01185 [Acetobacteraceae bacterium]
MTETDSSSTSNEKTTKPSTLDKISNALSEAERTISGASFLKTPSEPEKDKKENNEQRTPLSPEEEEKKTEEELKAEKAEEDRKKIEAEQKIAKEKAEAEARKELTMAQLLAKNPKTEKEMGEELEMLTASKNLTPAEVSKVLQWLIKQEIVQSERIKNLQKAVEKLSPKT